FFPLPTLAGAGRIAWRLLIGKLCRLSGPDAVIVPNYGGRFGHPPDTCRALPRAASDRREGLRPTVPVPAGGMTTARVGELLDFYGADVMLLIGGGPPPGRPPPPPTAPPLLPQNPRHSPSHARCPPPP